MIPKGKSIGDYERVLVPINRVHSHWLLGVVDVRRYRIIIVDSILGKLQSYSKELAALQWFGEQVLGLR